MSKKAKRSGGRPSEYDPETIIPIVHRCRFAGFKQTEIALVLRISNTTVEAWKRRYPAFANALKREPLEAAANVADSLYRRAMGFEYWEEKIIGTKNIATGEVVPQRIERTKKQVVPDTIACIFFLKNRAPQHWRDSQKVEIENPQPGKLFGQEIKDIPTSTLLSIIENTGNDSWNKALKSLTSHTRHANSQSESSHSDDSCPSASTPSKATSQRTT